MIEQGSDEWKQQRLGKVTASKIADLTAKTKTGWAASRANYAAELIIERLTGSPSESYTNAAMQWGKDTEPKARASYSLITDFEVEEAPFVPHPTILMSGASPDGFVNDDGLVEIKCPNTATHLNHLLGEAIDGKYVKQMQWQMACTGRLWCDFVSFDPRLPAHMQIKIQRVERDNAMISELEKHVNEFLAEIDSKLASLGHKPKETPAEDVGTFDPEEVPAPRPIERQAYAAS